MQAYFGLAACHMPAGLHTRPESHVTEQGNGKLPDGGFLHRRGATGSHTFKRWGSRRMAHTLPSRCALAARLQGVLSLAGEAGGRAAMTSCPLRSCLLRMWRISSRPGTAALRHPESGPRASMVPNACCCVGQRPPTFATCRFTCCSVQTTQ